MTIDIRRRFYRFRAAAALVPAATVFVLTYLAAWVNPRDIAMGDALSGRIIFMSDYKQISVSIDEFLQKTGRLPRSLDELPQRDLPEDPWGHPYHFEKTQDGFRIFSLGRDGEVGGEGIDADFDLPPDGRVHIEPTFWQFLFEGKASGLLFKTALGASFCAGMVWYLTARPTKFDFSHSVGLVVGTGAIIGIAFVIAMFLLACYLGMLGSGH